MPGDVSGGSPTVEPERFELEDTTWFEPCPKCPTQASGARPVSQCQARSPAGP